jgi:hypothetical protein
VKRARVLSFCVLRSIFGNINKLYFIYFDIIGGFSKFQTSLGDKKHGN